MRKYALGVLLCLQLVLSACATDPGSPSKHTWVQTTDIGANEVPAAGQGLLFVKINLKYASYCRPDRAVSVAIMNDKNFLISSAILPAEEGENLRAIVLPPGNYSWRLISMGPYTSSDFSGKMLFTIHPDVANYVGDLDLVVDYCSVQATNSMSPTGSAPAARYTLKVADRGDTVRSQFQTAYPAATQHFAFTPSITKDLRK